MKILLVTILLCIGSISCIPQSATPAGASKYTQLEDGEIKYLQQRGFGPQAFRTTQSYVEDEDEYELDNTQEGTQEREPSYSNYPTQRTTPVKAYPTPTPRTTYYASVTPKAYYAAQKQQQQYRRTEQQLSNPNNKLEEEEKEEEEEPDRLTLLLPQSKFQCQGRKTGYYADQDLGCEVFHYCHDNARHSWVCPEGFTFHQIQLICMPPGGDNNCEKSNDYHFVNEYLYKPVNLEEYQKKPYNTTLRYSDRYFPDSYRSKYEDDDYEDDRQQYRHSVRVVQQPQQAQQRYHQAVASTTFRPQSPLAQVYRNSDEINISLQQRRPQAYQVQYERK